MKARFFVFLLIVMAVTVGACGQVATSTPTELPAAVEPSPTPENLLPPTWTPTPALTDTPPPTFTATATSVPRNLVIEAPLDDLSPPDQLDRQDHPSGIEGDPQARVENGQGFVRFDPTDGVDQVYFLEHAGGHDFMLGNTPDSSLTVELSFRAHPASDRLRVLASALWWQVETRDPDTRQGWMLAYNQHNQYLSFSVYSADTWWSSGTTLKEFSPTEWVHVRAIKHGPRPEYQKFLG
jgi:hypothetical protein